MQVHTFCLLAGLLGVSGALPADEQAPWGRAKATRIDYAPQRVVYDVAAPDAQAFSRVLDRASYLNNLYHADPFGTSIVLVLHGEEIELFGVKSFERHKDLMIRAQSLTVGGTIEYRVCQVAARGRGLEPGDLHGFVKVVPMADAEIVRLQHEEGYAYMQ